MLYPILLIAGALFVLALAIHLVNSEKDEN